MKLKCIHIIRLMVGANCKIQPGFGTVYCKRRSDLLEWSYSHNDTLLGYNVKYDLDWERYTLKDGMEF